MTNLWRAFVYRIQCRFVSLLSLKAPTCPICPPTLTTTQILFEKNLTFEPFGDLSARSWFCLSFSSSFSSSFSNCLATPSGIPIDGELISMGRVGSPSCPSGSESGTYTLPSWARALCLADLTYMVRIWNNTWITYRYSMSKSIQ